MPTIYRTTGLIANVRLRCRDVGSGVVSDARVLRCLDKAQADLCLQLNDGVLEALSEVQTAALTLDAEPYSLPADFLRERHVQYKTVAAMRLQVHDLARALGDDAMLTPSESVPLYYLWDNKLWLLAGTKTAGNYTLYYLKRPPALTTGTNPVLPKQYDPLLEGFAVMRVAEFLGDVGLAVRCWQEYLSRVAVFNSRTGGGLPHDTIPGDRG